MLPKQLYIGGHLFTVTVEELDANNGETDWVTSTITIDSRLPQSHKEATLIHEILHVCNPTMDADVLGHALLDSLSEQLYQVLKHNGLLQMPL